MSDLMFAVIFLGVALGFLIDAHVLYKKVKKDMDALNKRSIEDIKKERP